MGASCSCDHGRSDAVDVSNANQEVRVGLSEHFSLESPEAEPKAVTLQAKPTSPVSPRSLASTSQLASPTTLAPTTTAELVKDDALVGASAEEVLAEVEACMARCDCVSAERVIMAALDAAVDAAALWQELKANPILAELCSWTGQLLVSKMTLASVRDDGWRSGPNIKVDWHKLCPSAPAATWRDIDPNCQVRWRVTASGGSVIQMASEMPTYHPIHKVPFSQPLIAMFSEIDLLHTWNPLISTKYPPKVLSASADYITWEEKCDIPWLLSEQGIIEMHRFFLPEGFYVQRTCWVMDPEDSRMKNMKRVPGCRLKDEPDIHTMIVAFGAEKTVVVITQENQLKAAPPTWLTEKFIWWLMPLMARKMLAVGAGIFERKDYCEGKDYGARMRADKHGLYARIQETCKLGEKRGTSYSISGRVPVPEDLANSGGLGARIERLEKHQ